jgi:hypothetical protein
MLKKSIVIFLIALSHVLNAQIRVDKFDLTIETELKDTLQKIYANFLNNDVEKISIVELEKKYNHSEYYSFLRNKKFYQRRKKWIRDNSYTESIIKEGKAYELVHFDSMVFEVRYKGIDKEFIRSEVFLDSSETKMALSEMFNGYTNEIISMCYNPRHAVIFYNAEGKVTGIFEICFECSNVKIGIVGTKMFAKSTPYIKSLFESHMKQ